MSGAFSRRVCVLGAAGVGKTGLVRQYCEQDFDERYAPSVDETYTANVSLPSQSQKRFQADILDTEGQDEFYIFRQDHAVGFDCYVLVYSVESRRSFDIVQVINEKLLNALGTESHPRVLVACKQDLPLPLHRVSQREGAELAKVWGCPFRECSAKTSQGVSEVFQSAIQEVEKDNLSESGERLAPPKKDGNCVLM